mmetsp:Transcript_356/g.701  ORF Transcript_356/g.701 Transcript_356/m.701 type:complete len:87 (+) Transcript_356:147-407(+)
MKVIAVSRMMMKALGRMTRMRRWRWKKMKKTRRVMVMTKMRMVVTISGERGGYDFVGVGNRSEAAVSPAFGAERGRSAWYAAAKPE